MACTYAPIDLGDVAAGVGGFVIHGEDRYDRSGCWVALAGDLNGDGFDDLIIGALSGDGAGNTKPNAGDSYVVFGKPDAFGAAVDLGDIAKGEGGFVIYGEDKSDQSGFRVASARDLNGDGFDDLIIGALSSDGAGNTKPNAGDSYVVFGKAGGFGAAVTLRDIALGRGGFVIHGEDVGDGSGFSLASAGDLNDDGFDDLIIGAIGAGGPGNTRLGAGGSYVVFGNAASFGAAVDLRDVAQGQGGFVIHGEDRDDKSGTSVASAGDLNGDGFDDLIIGAQAADGPGNSRGYAGGSYVVFGKAGGFNAAVDLRDIALGQGGFVIHGEDRLDVSGASVASAGDFNGDGFDDVIIGAFDADGPGNTRKFAGGSYVLFGKADGFDTALDLRDVAQGRGGFVIHGEDENDYSGGRVASAGDLNGDGFDDLIIGVRLADGPGNVRFNAGDTYVVFGKAGGSGAAVDLGNIARGQGGFVIHGEDRSDYSGYSVASAGDLNGDGFDDLIVGAYGADAAGNAKDGAGSTYVVFGGGFQPGPQGSVATDILFGGDGDEGIQGLAGDDRLSGRRNNDSLSGGAGDDRLRGGRDGDVLSGGEGADRFQFGERSLGTTDRILDFDAAEGDRISLRGIDAIAATPEDDRFTIIGTVAFSNTAGELRWGDIGRGVQRIEGDVDGDGAADLVIDIANDAAPVEVGWFVL